MCCFFPLHKVSTFSRTIVHSRNGCCCPHTVGISRVNFYKQKYPCCDWSWSMLVKEAPGGMRSNVIIRSELHDIWVLNVPRMVLIKAHSSRDIIWGFSNVMQTLLTENDTYTSFPRNDCYVINTSCIYGVHDKCPHSPGAHHAASFFPSQQLVMNVLR